jgi:hypothetical protein
MLSEAQRATQSSGFSGINGYSKITGMEPRLAWFSFEIRGHSSERLELPLLFMLIIVADF